MTPPPSRAQQDNADGRVLRGRRNRAAIVDAIYELIREGGGPPTARRVAERAGVQPRTVFRHFQDMESLNAEVSQRVDAEVRPKLLDPPGEGTLPERVATLARVRTECFEHFAPFRRVSNGMRARYPFVRAQHEASDLELREHLRRALPELRRLPAPLAAAVELLFSFEAWERLHTAQGLSGGQTRRAIEQSALALFASEGITD